MIELNIKELLKEKGKTKYWLVKNMEMGYQPISAIMENRTSAIKFETLDKLCHVLDCTPNEIIKYTK